jgi:hypothetical protein
MTDNDASEEAVWREHLRREATTTPPRATEGPYDGYRARLEEKWVHWSLEYDRLLTWHATPIEVTTYAKGQRDAFRAALMWFHEVTP